MGWEGEPPAALEEWSLVVEFRLRVPEEARPGRVELEVIVPYVQGSFGYYAFRLSRARVTVEVAP